MGLRGVEMGKHTSMKEGDGEGERNVGKGIAHISPPHLTHISPLHLAPSQLAADMEQYHNYPV